MSFHSLALVSHGACVYGHLPNIRVIDGHSAGTASSKDRERLQVVSKRTDLD
jgi:hypothetical protein